MDVRRVSYAVVLGLWATTDTPGQELQPRKNQLQRYRKRNPGATGISCPAKQLRGGEVAQPTG